MRATLFRQDALEHQRQHPLGGTLALRPLSFGLLTLAAVAIAAAVIAFIAWGEYTRKATVKGYLAPTQGMIKVHAPESGRLIERHAREGQAVRAGEALFVLSTERSSRETQEAQAAAIAQLRERRESLLRSREQQAGIDAILKRTTEEKLRGMQAELRQLDAEIATQERRVASAHSALERQEALLEQRFVSPAQVQQKNDELLDQRGRLQGLQRNRLSLVRDTAALRSELGSLDLKARTQGEAIDREISTVTQQMTEYESRRNVVITAPCDGTVTTILAEQGQTAVPDTPLLSILPRGAALHAHLLVPTRAIGFVAQEQAVALRYAAFPYQRFGSYRGKVAEISRTLITPGEASLPVKLEEPVYRVTVALHAQSARAYSEDVPLQAGMLLDADIWIDRRRIIEWIFDPILTVTGRL
jgi:membrane fusion protein